jgi:tellurite resistance protein
MADAAVAAAAADGECSQEAAAFQHKFMAAHGAAVVQAQVAWFMSYIINRK